MKLKQDQDDIFGMQICYTRVEKHKIDQMLQTLVTSVKLLFIAKDSNFLTPKLLWHCLTNVVTQFETAYAL